MRPEYIGLSLAIILLLGAGFGALLSVRVSGYLRRRRQARTVEEIFAETNRQQQLERVNKRRELYLGFRNLAAALVEELADGGGRWGAFYAVRDTLAVINSKAGPDVALAARQMCFVCQVMLNEGFSDSLFVRFNTAMQRFEDASRDDLEAEAQRPAWPPPKDNPEESNNAESGADSSARRRYYRVLR